MLNKSILMGRMTRDPELRHTNNNTAVISFTLAVQRDYKDGSGNYATDFIDCVAWGKLAEFVKQWFSRGSMAVVVGRLQSRQWQDKNGNSRTTIEVNVEECHFGESKKSSSPQNTQGYPQNDPYAPINNDFAELGDDDGQYPF